MSCREFSQEFSKNAGRSTFVPGSNGLSTVFTSRICSLRLWRTRSSIAEVSAWLCFQIAKPSSRPWSVPLTSAFSAFRGKYDPAETPAALRISENVLTLPLFADLAEEDVDRICDIVLKCGKQS